MRGSAGPAQLVFVDFGGVDGATPLRELIAHRPELAASCALVDPLKALASMGANASIEDCARQVVEGLPRAMHDPDAVVVIVANCTGAAFGLATASAFGIRGLAIPQIVILDPVLVDIAEVRGWATNLASRFGSSSQMNETISGLLSTSGADRVTVLHAIAVLLREAADAYANTSGYSAIEAYTVVGQLVDRYVEWLSYLLALADFKMPTLSRELRIVHSGPAQTPERFLTQTKDSHRTYPVADADPAGKPARRVFDAILFGISL